MVRNTTKYRVPNKIRKLIRDNDLGVLFVSGPVFRFFISKAGLPDNSIAMANDDEDLILLDKDQLLRYEFNQRQVNFILLHEIAHLAFGIWDSEEVTDTVASVMGDELDIPYQTLY